MVGAGTKTELWIEGHEKVWRGAGIRGDIFG